MSMLVHSAVGLEQAVETPYPNSPWVVMKFGGRSVSTAGNWAAIAALIEDRLAEPVTPFVCHSALAGVSNALIELLEAARAGGDTDTLLERIVTQHAGLADALDVDAGMLDELFATLRQLISGVRLVREVNHRVHARVLATGELAATRLGAAFLAARGLPVNWTDARRLLTSTEAEAQTERARYLSARCEFDADPDLRRQQAGRGGIILTQGFIAHNRDGETVLLGRGGSDTSAAYFASKLQARRLEIWTDVPGFFSTDPRSVPSARLIRSLHYQEAQEIASAGGGILHPRSIAPVRSVHIPLFLKCTGHPEWEGTVVSDAAGDDVPQLKAIAHRSGITLISMESMQMWHQVGFLADVFGRFRDHGISVDLISTSESNVTVSIDLDANVTDDTAIDSLVEDLGSLCRVKVIRDCAAIALVGRRIRTILHDLGPVLEVFGEHKVHLVTQAANDLNLTFVVSSEHAYRLVQHLHELLVDKFEGGVFGPTWERFSGGPAADSRPAAWWLGRRDELLEIGQRMGAAYVYDRASIARAIESLQALESVDAVFYSMKANSHPDVLALIHELGMNFECVSPGEIERVLELFPDLDRGRILFTPNFAARREYEWAVEQGVWLTLDNLFPLRHWGPLFADQEVFIRIDTGQGRGHHEHVRTAGAYSKFGVPMFEIDELADLVAKSNTRVVGLHAHTGSGVLNPDTWRDTGRRLAALLARFPEVRHLDLGGGLGIPEKPGQRPLDLAALDSALNEVKALCGDRQLWLEPGRFIVAQAGVLLTRVTQTKGKGNVQYVGVDTGMNSLIRPALYGAYHEIVNLSRLGQAPTSLVTVVGPICETGDRLGSDRLMPAAEEGDVLLIANAGAYGRVMSSQYNLRPPAKEVMI
ncbi:bifunctional aspartate kinase/diaminopimelate decarboxylase [Candidatus Rariloculus sp.]|uniref:bifunctional aspartate kinase/diaminopimelate decarboxylase n=1 Tax=Candidatus Rariloculus sp. TaxID=3101265 RepID=UPI003D148C11